MIMLLLLAGEEGGRAISTVMTCFWLIQLDLQLNLLYILGSRHTTHHNDICWREGWKQQVLRESPVLCLYTLLWKSTSLFLSLFHFIIMLGSEEVAADDTK